MPVTVIEFNEFFQAKKNGTYKCPVCSHEEFVANIAESKPDDDTLLNAATQAVRATGAANLIASIGNTDALIPDVARRAGVSVLRLDPTGGPGQAERSTYGKLLRWNLEAILAAGIRK